MSAVVVGSKNAGAGDAFEVPAVSASSDSSSDDTDSESAGKPRLGLTMTQHLAKGRRHVRNYEAAWEGKESDTLECIDTLGRLPSPAAGCLRLSGQC